jgi:lipopolysaccharide assembly outer membrane protein LptD (OstA)
MLSLPVASLPQQSTEPRPSETRRAVRDSVYRFDAGSSSLKDIGGEQFLEGRDGVRIVHGDVTITADRGLHYRHRRLSHLIGGVNIDQKELHMQGDSGEYSGLTGIAILRGRVRIVDKGLSIMCDEAVYNRRTEVAWAKGRVEVIDSTTTLTADSLYYDKVRLQSEAFGNVLVVDSKEGIRVRGGHGFYYRNEGKGVIDDVPRLTIDPESDEPATVDSDTMIFYPDDRVAIARGRVKILKGNTVTQCDSAIVLDSKKKAELYGSPLAKQGNVSMQGTQMVLHYDDEAIRWIKIRGRAMIKETQRDSLVVGRDSWVRGDSMLLYLRDNALDSLRVSGSSESEYYPFGGSRVEANYAKGDSMFFLFEDDSLSYVKMVGQASGVFRYVKLGPGETSDSLRVERDTSLVYVPFGEKAERVQYAGDTIQYYAKRRDLVLTSAAKVDYGGKTLTGKKITYSANLELLDATGQPILIEGEDKLFGKRMDYDLAVGTGLVREGTTQFMDGYYDGETIAKVGNDVLKVWNSTYTTCDLRVPHYHLSSNRMKVYLDDKVVTGPVVLYIGETPLVALPFFAQNIRRGRRSGILRPDFEFGITSEKNRFIRDVGYYWATNDYTDFTFVGDFNENESVRFRAENRYKLRYVFDGGLDFSWLRDLRDYRNEWTLDGDHNQTLGEKASFSARLRFVSSDRAQQDVNNIDDVADVVDRRIESTASLRKAWSSVGFSASARRAQILNVEDPRTVRISAELPNVILSIPSRSLYFGKASKKGYGSIWEKVLGGIRVSPGLSGSRKTEQRLGDWTETITTTGSLSSSAPFRVAFLSLSPQASVSDTHRRTTLEFWNRQVVDTSVAPPDTSRIEGREVTSENQVTASTGVSASTNLYGTFAPNIGALRGIRHTVSPSATFGYTPAIQGRRSVSRVSLSVRNAIDLKVATPRKDEEETPPAGGEQAADTTAGKTEEKEGQTTKLSGVFLWSLSTSYVQNQATREFTWSRISSLVNLRVLGTSVSVSQSIDPYGWEIENTSLTSSVSFRGTHPFGRAAASPERELNVVAADSLAAETAGTEGEATPPAAAGKQEETQAEEEKGLPWDLSVAFSYSKSRGFEDPSSTLNLGGSLNLTRGWRLTYRTTYNVVSRDFLQDFLSVTRDLHCWEMSLGRQKLGDEWEFYFKIYIKSHPEIYAEQGNRGLGAGSFLAPLSY